MTTKTKPAHLQGEMATLWDTLNARADANGVVVVNKDEYPGLSGLELVAGVQTSSTTDGKINVQLLYGESTATASAEVDPATTGATVAAKEHKFANEA